MAALIPLPDVLIPPLQALMAEVALSYDWKSFREDPDGVFVAQLPSAVSRKICRRLVWAVGSSKLISGR
jgi:hypothetical protein